MRLFPKRVSADAVRAVAVARIHELRQLSFDVLAALPSQADATEQVGGREVSVSTWRDEMPDGRTRIVVQAYLYHWLGMGTMTADGFIVGPDGLQAHVPEEMMREFL